MLSRSAGLTKRSHVLGFRRDIQATQGTTCPLLKKYGQCRGYERECTIRQQIAREKEEELKKKATAMYALQMDLIADMEADGGGAADPETAQVRQLLVGGEDSVASVTPAEAIQRLVQELKAEPEYVHWNLEGAVAERMVEQRVRRCRYSHRIDALLSLKRARHVRETEEAGLLQRERQEEEEGQQHPRREKAPGRENGSHTSTISSGCAPAAVAAFSAERARVFASFTPLQRCVVSLMWQRSIRLPRGVVSTSIRAEVEREAEAEMRAQLKSSGGEHEEWDEEVFQEYLGSPAFEERVRAAEASEIERIIFMPALGVLDLAALPQIVSYVSQNQKRLRTITDATATFFSATSATLFATGKGSPVVTLTEKELDLSPPPRAAELVEAVEWCLHVYNTERRLHPSSSSSPLSDALDNTVSAHAKLSHRAGRVVLRSLSLRNAQMTLADGLITSLHKSGLRTHLLALDLSDNRLHSLRFLFVLRAHFAERLLRLSLKNNLITRKPEYQEQVRRSLPRLTSLDGEPIRRPPLRFPKSRGASYTTLSLVNASAAAPAAAAEGGGWAGGSAVLTPREYDSVMDTVARLFYIWETRRVPHTQRERAAFVREARRTASNDASDEEGVLETSGGHQRRRKETGATAASVCAAQADINENNEGTEEEEAALLPVEEELNEDNFPHRYLHPGATFSFTVSPGLVLFDPQTVKLDREVELDDTFTGMRLHAHDLKDARVFDVAVRNSSRNLLVGRSALQRVGHGAENCYLAYQYSIYPERVEVDHGLAGAVVSVVKMPLSLNSNMSSGGTATGWAKDGFGTGAIRGAKKRNDFSLFIVTLHGTMTWRLPSMRGEQCFSAAYDRTLTFTHKMLAAQNYAWERRRSPMLVLCNDQLLLRPVLPTQATAAVASTMQQYGGIGPRMVPIFSAATRARAARLVVQFGLEACCCGEAFVIAVMERTTSDAAEEAALDALVFGPTPDTRAEKGSNAKDEEKKARREKGDFKSRNTAVAAADDEHEDEAEAWALAHAMDAAVRPLLLQHIAKERALHRRARRAGQVTGTASNKAATDTVYPIFSLLDRPATSGIPVGPPTSYPSVVASTPTQYTWGGSNLHRVPLSLLEAVTQALNACLSMNAFTGAHQRAAHGPTSHPQKRKHK